MKILIFCLFLSISLLQLADSAVSKSSNEDEPKLGIVNGLNAASDEGKHVVQIWKNGDFSCGGSLIDSTTVISAAHCAYKSETRVFHDPKIFTIRYGTHMLKRSKDKDIEVKWIKVHPSYVRSDDSISDISIFKLREPIVEGENVAFIELQQTELKSTSEAFTLYGFGRNHPIIEEQLPEWLQKEFTFNGTEEDYREFIGKNLISEGTILTRSPNSTACYGDSGSGLVHKKKLIGVASTILGIFVKLKVCSPGDFEGFAPIAFPENLNFVQQNRAEPNRACAVTCHSYAIVTILLSIHYYILFIWQ